MVTLLVVKPRTLTKLDTEKLRENDIIVVESKEPETVRWLKPGEIFDPNDMMRAALYSIAKSGDLTKARFVDQLAIIGKAVDSASGK